MSREADVRGKTIVITGASSGFGRGAAIRLGELGANVVVAARRGEVLDDVVDEIAAAGGSALAVPLDVSDRDAVELLAGQAKLIVSETEKGTPVSDTNGAIYEPMVAGTTVSGGMRERMEREDAARHEDR